MKGRGGGKRRKKIATSCSFSQTISSDCSVSLINTVQKVIAIIKHLIATLPLSDLSKLHPPALRRSGGAGLVVVVGGGGSPTVPLELP